MFWKLEIRNKFSNIHSEFSSFVGVSINSVSYYISVLLADIRYMFLNFKPPLPAKKGRHTVQAHDQSPMLAILAIFF